MNTPVLLLAFNRPDLTMKVYEVIRLVKPKKLYVSIDGPRLNNQNDLTNINIIISFFNDIDWDCEFKLNKFKNNLGCGKAISQGINWFFNEVEYGIILEDDTIPSISFFEFTSTLLNKYYFNNEIFAINGSNPLSKSNSSSSYFYSYYNLCWGWGTWKRAWDKYEFDFSKKSNFTILLNLIKRFRFDFISIRSWYKHILLVKRGKIDTWDYQWMYLTFSNQGKVITPSYNLITNCGNDNNPTHKIKINVSYTNLNRFEINFPLIDPKESSINKIEDKKIKEIRFGNTFLSFLTNKIKHLIS